MNMLAYEELLHKYIVYLNKVEGSDFINQVDVDEFFTEEEVKVLEQLSETPLEV